MIPEELRHRVHARLEKRRKVGAHLNAVARFAERLNEPREVGVQLRSAACEIHELAPHLPGRVKNQLRGWPVHHLGPVRSGPEMAMHTVLIAPKPKIDLYAVYLTTMQHVTEEPGYALIKIVHRHPRYGLQVQAG